MAGGNHLREERGQVLPPDLLPDRMYTTSQVAEIFGVCPETVLRWVRSGRLAHSPTRYYFFRGATLLEFGQRRLGVYRKELDND